MAVVGDGANTWAPSGRSGTQLYDTDNGAYGDGEQYLLQGTAGLQAMSWTFGTSDDWAEVVAAFKEVIVATPTITVGDGAAPGDASLCPGGAATYLDYFTLSRTSNGNTVTAVTVTLAPAGSYNNISLVEITNDAGAALGSLAPASDTPNITGLSIALTTTATQYRVRITPKSHATMDPPSTGASYAVTGTVTAITQGTPGDNVTYSDTASATVTIDNLSPNNATWGTVTPGDAQVVLNWTNPGGDFSEVVILRNTASITDAPTEGATYSSGNTIGTSVVRYVGALQTFTDTTVSNGTAYYYKIFAKDTCGNYAAGVQTGPYTPKATLTVDNGTSRRAPSTLCRNKDEVIDQFKLTASTGTITVTSITITGSASVTGTISGVKLYKDVNNNGTYESGTDTQVGLTQTFAGGTVTFAPLTESINTTGTNYLVVYTVAAGAADGTVVTSNVTTVVATGSPNITWNNTVSNNMTIKQYPSLITNFTAACAATSANLAWNNPPENNLGEVKVLRKTGGYPSGPGDGTATQVYQNLSPTSGGAVNVNDSPLTTGTTYYWAVYSKDNCGNWNTATTAGSNAASCMASAADQLTVSNAGDPAAANVAQASTNNVIDRLSFSANANDITITSVKIKLVDGAGTTPIQASDIASVHLYDDANKNGVLDTGETFLGSGVFSSVDNTCTISGLSFTITAPTTREMLIVFNIASAAVAGRKFKSQVDSGYITVASPDTVNAFTSIVSNTFTIIAGGGVTGSGFTVSILNPRDGGVVSGTFKVQVQVYWGANPLTAVKLSSDGGSTYPTTLTQNTNYLTGANSGIYEAQLTLTPGAYTLKAQASNLVPQTATSRSIVVTVNPAGKGDGNLLARDNSSQLCLDCHNLQTHSSQYSTTTYGNWAMNCRDCHTAHETRNIYLVREKIPTPTFGLKSVTLYDLNNLASGTGTGLCEACHSQTGYYKSDSSGDAGSKGHDSGNCSSCHIHTTGFKKLFCNDCHNAPPSPGNDRHATHYNTATVPTSYTYVTNDSTSSAYIYPCAKCHSGTHRNSSGNGSSGNPYLIEVSFDNTVDPKNPSGSYSSGGSTYDDIVNGKYYRYTNGTCSGIYCHSNATPLTPGARGVPTAYTTPTWMGATTSPNCTVCHLGADTYTNMTYATTTRALSDAHWMHAANDRYNLGCKRCHNATVSDNTTVSDKSKHVNGVKNWQFDNNGTFDNTGGSYNASYQCLNIYCHSNGQSLTPPFGSPTSAAWNATAPLACDSCHYGSVYNSNTNKMSSGKHTQHINQASVLGSNYYCNQCHYNTTTVTASKDAIASYTYHVNGARDVAFDTTGGKTNGAGPNWTAPSTCANIYCHSSGQATPTYRTVPSWTAGGPLDCKGCHGTEGGSLWGEPRYANGGPNLNNSNTHPKHVGPSASTGTANCGYCHPNTADNTPAIVASSTIHTNGSREVAQGGVVTFTYAAGKTCNSISCHNGASGLVWGQTTSLPTCLSCHGAAADSNDLGATFWKNGTPAKINTTEWTYGGHGKTSGTYDSTGNPAANLTSAGGDGSDRCYYCHNTSISHYDDSNPFRLANYNATGDDWNSTCLVCHKTGSAGYNPGQGLKNGTIKVDTAHRGVKHDINPKGGRFCWDCHDPHGERPSNTNSSGNNVAMIGRQVMKKSDGVYGYLGASGVAVSVQLYDVNTAGQAVGRLTEATNTPRQGICQACHDASEVLSNDMTKYWRLDGTDLGPVASAHNAATICTQCHKHTDNFKGSGACMDCHNQTQTKTKGTAGTIRPIVGASGDFTLNKAGHLINGNVGAGYDGTVTPDAFVMSRGAEIVTNWDCIVCHAEGDMSSTSTDIKKVSLHGADGAGVGKVLLRNVDTPGAAPGPGTENTNYWAVDNRNWTTADFDKLDKFCVSCHDSGGATGIAVNGTTGLYLPPSAAQALTPFNSGDNRRNAYDKFVRTRVTDVKTAMNKTNYSVHAMSANSDPGGGNFGARYTNKTAYAATNGRWWDGKTGGGGVAGGAWTGKKLRDGTVQGTTTGLGETAVMHCSDCHLSSQNAHGARYSWYMLDNSGNIADATYNASYLTYGTDAQPMYNRASGDGTANSSNYVCFKCHAKAVYAHVDDAPVYSRIGHTTGSTAGNHFDDATNNVFGYVCMTCHGGGGTNPSTVNGALGNIHGVNVSYKSPSDSETHMSYRFFPGGWMMWNPPGGTPNTAGEWGNTGTGTCYFQDDNGAAWSGCSQHNAGNKTTTVRYGRPATY